MTDSLQSRDTPGTAGGTFCHPTLADAQAVEDDSAMIGVWLAGGRVFPAHARLSSAKEIQEPVFVLAEQAPSAELCFQFRYLGPLAGRFPKELLDQVPGMPGDAAFHAQHSSHPHLHDIAAQ